MYTNQAIMSIKITEGIIEVPDKLGNQVHV